MGIDSGFFFQEFLSFKAQIAIKLNYFKLLYGRSLSSYTQGHESGVANSKASHQINNILCYDPTIEGFLPL